MHHYNAAKHRTTINSWALEYINYTRRTFIYEYKSTVPNISPMNINDKPKKTKQNYYPQFIFVNLAFRDVVYYK